MAGTITNEGEKLLLEAAVGKVAAGPLKLKLFTSNTTPAHDDVVADYTEVGAVQGYAEKTLAAASWGSATAGTGSGSSSSNAASIEYPQQTFTADGTGGSQTVYGYIITNDAETILVGAERFSSPQTWASAGDAIRITPKLRLRTE